MQGAGRSAQRRAGSFAGRPDGDPAPPGACRRAGRTPPGSSRLRPRMDRRLARKNIRTSLIAGAVCLVMFGMTFVAAVIYVA